MSNKNICQEHMFKGLALRQTHSVIQIIFEHKLAVKGHAAEDLFWGPPARFAFAGAVGRAIDDGAVGSPHEIVAIVFIVDPESEVLDVPIGQTCRIWRCDRGVLQSDPVGEIDGTVAEPVSQVEQVAAQRLRVLRREDLIARIHD